MFLVFMTTHSHLLFFQSQMSDCLLLHFTGKLEDMSLWMKKNVNLHLMTENNRYICCRGEFLPVHLEYSNTFGCVRQPPSFIFLHFPPHYFSVKYQGFSEALLRDAALWFDRCDVLLLSTLTLTRLLMLFFHRMFSLSTNTHKRNASPISSTSLPCLPSFMPSHDTKRFASRLQKWDAQWHCGK